MSRFGVEARKVDPSADTEHQAKLEKQRALKKTTKPDCNIKQEQAQD